METELSDWEKNLKYFRIYDFLQLEGSSRYPKMLNWHIEELKNCKNILETGAGTGNLTQELLKKGYEITAIDINFAALEILKNKCQTFSNKLKIYNMSVNEIDFKLIKPNSFDGTSSMIVHPFPNDNLKYLQNVYSALKKGGKHVITSWASTLDIYYGVIEMLEEELKEKELLDAYPDAWNHIKKSGVGMAKMIVEKNLTLDTLVSYLEKTKFQNIEIHESPYGKYAYAITAFK